MTRAGVFVLFWLTCTLCRAQPGTYMHYTTANGLVSNTTYDILQDDHGFIWISSIMGVQRFDGTDFRLFTREDGLPDSEVLRINKDRFGRIWFFGFNGRIAYFENEKFFNEKNHAVLGRLKFKAVPLHFYEGRNHVIHIVDQAGQHMKVYVDAHGISDIEENPQRVDFYWEEGGESYFLRRRKIYKYGNPKKITDIVADNFAFWTWDGKFYYQNKKGIMVFSKDSTWLCMPWPHGVDEASRYLVYNNGITILDGKKGPLVYNKTGNGHILTHTYEGALNGSKIFWDNNGGTWVTSLTDGLYFYPKTNRKFRFTEPAPGWPGKNISEMQLVDNRYIIAGFDNSSIGIFDTNLTLSGSSQITVRDVYHPVSDIARLGGGTFVVSGSSGGHFMYLSQGSRKPVFQRFLIGSIKNMAVAPTGEIYFSSITSIGVYDPKTDSISYMPTDAFRSRKYAVCPIGDDNFLFSDIDGLHYQSKTGGEKKLPDHPFLKKRIIKILPVPDGQFVLITDGEGIALADGSARHIHIVPGHAMHNGVIKKALLYNNELWVAGSKGIGVFVIQNKRLRPKRWIDESNGLLSPDVSAFCIGGGFLYVFTPRGFQKMNLETLSQSEKTPKLFIHTLESGTKKWTSPSGKIDLPAGCREVKLQCSALSLDNPSATSFAYRFNGASPYIGSGGPSISIPIEWEGEKTLFVRCRKGEGNWTEDTRLLLAVPVPFHKQVWVQVVAYLLLTGGLVAASLYFANRIRKRQRREKDMKLQIALSEIKSLQAMMNPHFIFNTLNSIQHFVNEHDAYNINRYFSLFSRLIRSNLNSTREPMILLQREVEYLKNYLELEKMRFGEKLHYDITVDENINADEILVPGMLIQPLLENAIKHGIVTNRNGGKIRVGISRTEERLQIRIKDDGSGLYNKPADIKNAGLHKSLGIEMIRERLAILTEMYGKPFTFELTDNARAGEETGATATVTLPILYA